MRPNLDNVFKVIIFELEERLSYGLGLRRIRS